MAGFAGSSAAFEPTPANTNNPDIVADSATADASDTIHTVTYKTNPANFTGSNQSYAVNVSYGSGFFDTNVGNENISVFINGTQVNNESNVINTTDNDNFIEVSELNESGNSVNLSSGEHLITVEIQNATNPSNNLTTDIAIEGTDGSEGTSGSVTRSADLAVDEGPIDVGGTSFSTLHNALDAASSGDTVKINQDVKVSPLSPFSEAIPSGVTLEGSGGALSVSDLNFANVGINQAIDISNNNNTVTSLTVEGNNQSVSAVAGTSTKNTTVSQNTFNDFNNATLTITTSNSTGPDTLDISGNTFTGDESKAVEVDASGFTTADDTVKIDSNDITLASGGHTAIDIIGGGGTGQIDIISGSIEVDAGSDDTGVSTNNDKITIDGVNINATYTGIDATATGETLVISSTTITNSSGSSSDTTAIDVVDAGPTTTVINGSTTVDQAQTGISLDLSNDGSSTADINNILINGTSGGVDLVDLNDDANQPVNVTSSTFTTNDPAALNYSVTGTEITNTRLNIHFNTFESNAVGIGIDDGGSPGDNDNLNAIFNTTFNKFVNNDVAGVDVQRIGLNGNINANYS